VFYEVEQDPLCYPGTSVLINKGDIRNQRDLDDFEFAMFLTRAEEPLPGGGLDYPHYRAIHHHLFQDVYGWAGQPRVIRIAKGGNWFCFPEHLQAHMDRVFGRLHDRHFLVELGAADFAVGAADILAEINAGHPFREWNGRTQLTFLKLLAANAGLPFDDDAIKPAPMIEAMIRSFHGDLAPLTSIIGRIVA
jgi:cell filamentation protein